MKSGPRILVSNAPKSLADVRYLFGVYQDNVTEVVPIEGVDDYIVHFDSEQNANRAHAYGSQIHPEMLLLVNQTENYERSSHADLDKSIPMSHRERFVGLSSLFSLQPHEGLVSSSHKSSRSPFADSSSLFHSFGSTGEEFQSSPLLHSNGISPYNEPSFQTVPRSATTAPFNEPRFTATNRTSYYVPPSHSNSNIYKLPPSASTMYCPQTSQTSMYKPPSVRATSSRQKIVQQNQESEWLRKGKKPSNQQEWTQYMRPNDTYIQKNGTYGQKNGYAQPNEYTQKHRTYEKKESFSENLHDQKKQDPFVDRRPLIDQTNSNKFHMDQMNKDHSSYENAKSFFQYSPPQGNHFKNPFGNLAMRPSSFSIPSHQKEVSNYLPPYLHAHGEKQSTGSLGQDVKKEPSAKPNKDIIEERLELLKRLKKNPNNIKTSPKIDLSQKVIDLVTELNNRGETVTLGTLATAYKQYSGHSFQSEVHIPLKSYIEQNDRTFTFNQHTEIVGLCNSAGSMKEEDFVSAFQQIICDMGGDKEYVKLAKVGEAFMLQHNRPFKSFGRSMRNFFEDHSKEFDYNPYKLGSEEVKLRYVPKHLSKKSARRQVK